MITKHTKEFIAKPQVVKKRSYKKFSKDAFIEEIKDTDFKEVTESIKGAVRNYDGSRYTRREV